VNKEGKCKHGETQKSIAQGVMESLLVKVLKIQFSRSVGVT